MAAARIRKCSPPLLSRGVPKLLPLLASCVLTRASRTSQKHTLVRRVGSHWSGTVTGEGVSQHRRLGRHVSSCVLPQMIGRNCQRWDGEQMLLIWTVGDDSRRRQLRFQPARLLGCCHRAIGVLKLERLKKERPPFFTPTIVSGWLGTFVGGWGVGNVCPKFLAS